MGLSKQDGSVDYPVADTAASLVYLADQGTITLHAALARIARPYHPDRLVFDLDPPGDRVFLDCLRNAYGQTAVARYSLRARPGAQQHGNL
ncbi:MAG: hypothetical protein ACNA8J_03760 [Gammaproteobacteria bacterium]